MIHDTQSAPQISQKQDERKIYVIMKTMCSPSYHQNDFVATHALRHMMYVYTLLVPMNQRALNKPSKEHNISGHKWPTTHRVLKSHRSKMSIIYMLPWKHICFKHNSSCSSKISLDDDKNDDRFCIDIGSCFKMDFVLEVALKFTCI